MGTTKQVYQNLTHSAHYPCNLLTCLPFSTVKHHRRALYRQFSTTAVEKRGPGSLIAQLRSVEIIPLPDCLPSDMLEEDQEKSYGKPHHSGLATP
jgi:hypothetical protein